MTHSLHREGSAESLKDDFCLLAYCTSGVNDEDADQKILNIIEILNKHGVTNMGVPTSPRSMEAGLTVNEVESTLEKLKMPRIWCSISGRSNIKKVLKELKERDYGFSITVSGLIDDIAEISRDLDIRPHTISLSLGIHGNKHRLPSKEILEMTTMCGHGLISKNLVSSLLSEVKQDRISVKDAAKKLAKPCTCGIFNPKRAEDLINNRR